MKKLFALLVATVILFTACGSGVENQPSEGNQTPPIDEKIYEYFTFDESAIVSQEERKINTEGAFSVTGGENPADWHYIDEFDGEGRLMRSTCYISVNSTEIRELKEYSYADHGHYIRTTQPGNDKVDMVTYRYYSADGLYTDVYTFDHGLENDSYYYSHRFKTEKSADGKTTDVVFYDNTGEERTRTVSEKNDDGFLVKATYYTDGIIDSVSEVDWDKNESKTTVYKEGQPSYVKVTVDSGNTYTYFDLDGNQIDNPPLG